MVTAAGSFLSTQLIYQGKSKRYLSKFTFLSEFHVIFTANLWSNLEKCKDLFSIINFPHLSVKWKGFGYPKEQHSLIIMATFIGNDGMKRLSRKNS